MTTISTQVKQYFTEQFQTEPEYSFFSPGRINLIGEHTDYNGGYVFPCAITLGTYAQVSKRTDRTLQLYSQNFKNDGIYTIDLDHLDYQKEDGWTNYVKGMFSVIESLGHSFPYGLNIAFYGNIPNGAGLSSSASLEMLVGVIATSIYQLNIDPISLVKLGKKVENEFIGVNSGIMDQFAVAMGEKNHAILLDCNSLDYSLVPLDLNDHVIVIMNTNKRRELADSKYNERFQETRQALKELQQIIDIQTLCDLSVNQFNNIAHHLSSPVLFKRAKHAVSENERTKLAVEALQQQDLKKFGQLLKESHLSTELDYEITGLELDTLVHTAWEQEGVLGARMTGAGFGGCAIAIVQKDCVPAFQQAVATQYTKIVGYAPSFYIAEIANGAIIGQEES